MTPAGNDLVLEVRDQENETVLIGSSGMLAPFIHDDYWQYRIRLSDEQAIVGFPKFSTIGIGFAKEEDWNTNLPYHCDAEEIYQHIEHNKDDDAIPRQRCIEAIRLIQAQITPCGKPGRWIDKCVLPAGHEDGYMHADYNGGE